MMPGTVGAEALGLGACDTKMRLLRARLQLREPLTQTPGDPQSNWSVRITPTLSARFATNAVTFCPLQAQFLAND